MEVVFDPITDAKLSIQRALLGEVSSKLRAVVFSVNDDVIEVRFYYDGIISEDDKESASCVETEILADYGDTDTVTVRCSRIDPPLPILDEGTWVYQRRED